MRQETILSVLGTESLEYSSLVIDKTANLVIYATDADSTTLLLDSVITPIDNIKETARISTEISSELLQGFNSSIVLVSVNTKVSAELSADIISQISALVLLEGVTANFEVFEVYGDTVRDLVDINSKPKLIETMDGLSVSDIAAVPVSNISDLQNVLKRVEMNCEKYTKDASKSWMIYTLELSLSEGMRSRFRVICACSIMYSSVLKSKLVMTEGVMVAESMTAFYDAVIDPSLLNSAKSMIPCLLENEIGGNCSMRWMGILTSSDLESDVALWLFKLLGRAREIENIPITNTKFVVENRKRNWLKSRREIAQPTERVVNERARQRETDLVARINTLITNGSEMQENEQKYKKQVLEHKMKLVEEKLNSSKLKDDITALNDKIQQHVEKERKGVMANSEKLNIKIGLEKRTLQSNEKLALKSKQLEFHIHQLLNQKDLWDSQSKDLGHDIEILRKHNYFLQEMVNIDRKKIPVKFKTSALKSTVLNGSNGLPISEEIQGDLHEMFEKYRIKTVEQIKKCESIVTSNTASSTIIELNDSLLTSYKDHEHDLLQQIKNLKSEISGEGSSLDLRKELAVFMQETQFRLEKEKYALLAKCSALEEEVG